MRPRQGQPRERPMLILVDAGMTSGKRHRATFDNLDDAKAFANRFIGADHGRVSQATAVMTYPSRLGWEWFRMTVAGGYNARFEFLAE